MECLRRRIRATNVCEKDGKAIPYRKVSRALDFCIVWKTSRWGTFRLASHGNVSLNRLSIV